MQTTQQPLLHRTWTRDTYLISTDPLLIPIADLNSAFASDLVYWANPLSEDIMRKTLDSSLCFGLYDTKPTADVPNTPPIGFEKLGEQDNRDAEKLIGFARCVTDFSTFSYLTDVYVLPSHQGQGLGSWVLRCVKEVLETMPHLRRSMLFTSDWEKSVPFYEKVLGMEIVKGSGRKEGGGPAVMQKLGPGFPEGLR